MVKESLLKFTKSEKKPENQEEVKNLTEDEKRDLKAKETVSNLLSDVKLTPQGDDELLEMDNGEGLRVDKTTEWLSEQMTLLNKENEKLRQESEVAKSDYGKIFAELQHLKSNLGVVDEGAVKSKVIELFEELQDNYIKMGINPATRRPNFEIIFPAFLERMVMFFPFLANRKKYRV
jgi:hypothetical protein